MIRVMLGLGATPAPRRTARLAQDIPANGPREHYMRAPLTDDGLTPAERQDSSLLSVLARANALMIRPPDDPARAKGDRIDYIDI